ncbi:hypothetical protein GE253_03215 [Niveispirillum sp. SYP-B3756]|uniref:hypothetical protein n=1 Tax=Niveispirillum sp. SYP-B3756 TaxID=2662178 RepID=UPI00129169F5|nr:hypothetical protein [Niveispirillum sp. SYP-B3756]MQP64347.1 hypothetical protein [Niveispirillum sp. SYP-B3756]
MIGFLRRLTGQKAETPATALTSPVTRPEVPASPVEPDREPVAVAPTPTAAAPAPVPPPPAPAHPGPGEPTGPVFSSRAVRDATVVTGAVESLGRFVNGQDVIGDLIHRLEMLTPDQVNFLQLSAEPGLIQRALQRAEVQKGTKAAALRKLLGDLAGGAIPEADRSDSLLMPTGPILPPLASLKPKQASPGGVAESPTAPVVTPTQTSPARPAPLAPPSIMPGATASSSQAASVAAAVAAAPLPPRPRSVPPSAPVVPARAEPKVAVRPDADRATASDTISAPAMVSLSLLATDATSEAPPPVPAPPPSVPAAESASLPRLARADAETRRARLMAALNDHLSANEAAP